MTLNGGFHAALIIRTCEVASFANLDAFDVGLNCGFNAIIIVSQIYGFKCTPLRRIKRKNMLFKEICREKLDLYLVGLPGVGTDNTRD